jgi:hypothetical protein
MQVKRNYVQGLVYGSRQLDSLHKCIDRGQFADLLVDDYHRAKVKEKDIDDDGARLRYDAKTLHPFYKSAVSAYEPYRIVPAVEFAAAVAKATPQPATKLEATALPLKASVFPNPANRQVTIQYSSALPHTVQLLALNGQVLHTERVASTATSTLAVDKLPAGAYMVKVTEDSTGRTASQRLLVQR